MDKAFRYCLKLGFLSVQIIRFQLTLHQTQHRDQITNVSCQDFAPFSCFAERTKHLTNARASKLLIEPLFGKHRQRLSKTTGRRGGWIIRINKRHVFEIEHLSKQRDDSGLIQKGIQVYTRVAIFEFCNVVQENLTMTGFLQRQKAKYKDAAGFECAIAILSVQKSFFNL